MLIEWEPAGAREDLQPVPSDHDIYYTLRHLFTEAQFLHAFVSIICVGAPEPASITTQPDHTSVVEVGYMLPCLSLLYY